MTDADWGTGIEHDACVSPEKGLAPVIGIFLYNYVRTLKINNEGLL